MATFRSNWSLLILALPLLFLFIPFHLNHSRILQSFLAENQLKKLFVSPQNQTKKIDYAKPPILLISTTTNFSKKPPPKSVVELGTDQKKAVLVVNKEMSSLERVEAGLAIARASIRRAILTRNFTAEEAQDYIPRGDIYRNAYAFHQSYIEMEKRFKIWSYREGDVPLVHEGPCNDIYSIEGQMINEIESPISFLTDNPEKAHVYFLPFSIASSIHYVYRPKTFARLTLQRMTSDYINIISNKYIYWNRSHGADHFIVSCHDWAPDATRTHPELYKNSIRVLCNANTSEGFKPDRDVTVPETNLRHGLFPPRFTRSNPSQRSNLAFFSGANHGQIRASLLRHWKGKDKDIQVYEFLPKHLNYTKLMIESKFCLCPSGHEVASPRIVEAINVGCVPVLISDHYVLPFSDVLDWSKFSVQIPVDKIPEIKQILQGISQPRYMKLYTRVKQVQKHFVVNRPARRFDIIHMVLHSVWLRRLNFNLLPTNN